MKGGRFIKNVVMKTAEGTSGWTCVGTSWNWMHTALHQRIMAAHEDEVVAHRVGDLLAHDLWRLDTPLPVGAHVQRAHGQPALLPSFGPMDCGCSKRSKRFSKGWTGDIFYGLHRVPPFKVTLLNFVHPKMTLLKSYKHHLPNEFSSFVSMFKLVAVNSMQLRCGTLALATIVTSGIQATRSKLVVTVWFIYVYLLYGLLYGVCIYIYYMNTYR